VSRKKASDSPNSHFFPRLDVSDRSLQTSDFGATH
jgi:hypothetical protein